MFMLDINTQHQVQISSIDANANLTENLLKNSFQTRWRFNFLKLIFMDATGRID